MEVVKFCIENWAVMVALFCAAVFVGTMVFRFLNMPTAKQIENVKEWLRYAVIECEKELGSKTGNAK